MAKRAVCSKKSISFKTKRGKTISFTGRPGGTVGCGKKARKVTSWMRAVGRAGKACAKKARPGTATNTKCLKSHLSTSHTRAGR